MVRGQERIERGAKMPHGQGGFSGTPHGGAMRRCIEEAAEAEFGQLELSRRYGALGASAGPQVRYWILCVGENCTWHFKATSINDSAMFKVRNFNSQHTCSLMHNTFIQRKPTVMVVGSMVIPKYSDPKTIYTPKDIQTDMLSEHGVNLTYMQAWRAKEKALQLLRGHPADSYIKLPSYLYISEKTYPGSVVKLKKTDDAYFLYVFVAICRSISGWEYCRPVVVVDGTFLKSAYREIMLTTSTMDATGTILPLAYAVIDSKNDASWK
uniref:Uncharacterized protein LOC104234515 n=1 Tax=Nicotiana sylvestris TaxID=4096 RepID=A0A1U7X6A7_NICSY|nr:PREDICTED: uncharacterized protein LOC104234515 [Nicotiana sylvestris]